MNRIKELEDLILKHKALYYQGRPEISDNSFDKLEDELKSLDPENAVLNIVGSVSSNLEKVKHDKKMLSLDKTYDEGELLKWINNRKVISMYKVDGVSCSLIYENQKFHLAKTRGDGSFGENITSKLLWMSDVPKHISPKNKIEIRGELYCKENDFFHLSEEMEKMGLEKPTSQRNIVAGFMGRKENLELCRYLSFMAFDVIGDESIEYETQKFKLLEKENFKIPDIDIHLGNETTSHSIKSTLEDAKNFMSEGDYQIDGLVFSLDSIKEQVELGETAHHPRYKIAFKFQGESKETSIKEIIWSVSRNGILTPVAEVEPVELSGATISRVTLHNYGLVRQFQLKRNDVIEIIRSGEVIPKFLAVKKSSDDKFEIPQACPVCSSKVEINDIRLFCSNENCPGKNKELILNYIQKIGIEDLSSKRLDELLKNQMVKCIPDLYKLKEEDLLKLEKVKEKLCKKILSNIEKTKTTDLVTLLSSLGISGGAYNKCEKVVRAGFDTVEKIKKLTKNELMTIEGFAEKSSEEFAGSLAEKISTIDELLALGFVVTKEEKTETQVSGLKICITGALSEKREVIEDKIRKGSGIVVTSVSKNTDLLVTNEVNSESSKYKKAIELKIKIISENELLEMLG